MKKLSKIAVPLVFLVVIALVIGFSDGKTEKAQNVDPCAIDLLSTFLNNVDKAMTEETVARTILTQYLDAVKKATECPIHGIKDYQITSIGKIKKVQKDFMVDVKFDLLPISMEQTTWATPETTKDGEWVRGKQATLGIEKTENATSTSYRLVI